MTRVAWAIPAAAIVLALLGACSSEAPSERPLTTQEAQRLAITRFNNFDEGVRTIVATVPGKQTMVLTGWVDFVEHRGYVAVGTSDEAPGELGLYAWTGDTIAARDGAVPSAVLPPPTNGWQVDHIDPAASVVQNLLVVALSLGSDRPDNPTLLQQTDARWLRTDQVDGMKVDVISGPTSDKPASASSTSANAFVRYWIDERGRLLRVELRQPGTDQWTVLDLGEKSDVDLSPINSLLDGNG